MGMLSTVLDILGTRLMVDDTPGGRVVDVYFDDAEWRIRYLVATFGARRGVEHLQLVNLADCDIESTGREAVHLRISQAKLTASPAPGEVRPVCQQYQSMRYGSSQARFGSFARHSDPHLRSWRTVSQYNLEHAGEIVGQLRDCVFDRRTGAIRSLQVAQSHGGKILHSHLLPSAVERISWATGRVVLRYLQPALVGPVAEPEVAGFLAA